ncbi:histidine kinase [Luteimonas sp. XNQY3]|nr:histidine kinase [Luteimonas sp. XNQY3]MCD9008041.1 histidine kinase [Luteimonas sp. XNQY3]
MPATRKTLAAQWRWHLTHASRAYWIVQGAFALVYFAFSLVLVSTMTIAGSGSESGLRAAQVAIRMAFEGLLIAGIAHVAIRPALRVWFVQRQPALREWVCMLIWLLVLGYLSIALGFAFGSLTPDDGMNIEQVQFHTPGQNYDLSLSRGSLWLLGGFNQFSLLLLWSVLYLAWKAFEGRRQLQRQVRDARLQLLASQLNPHFLFNAFNTIRGMIFEDRERAAELVTQLSELFRFHLSAGARTEVTLAEDWEIARRYLDLEAVRLESRLRLEVDLDPELMPRTLPIMTLLTLVENAIKHGIAPNRDGGTLAIRASATDAGWQLEVENSVGRGVADYSGGHGLSNLRERVSLSGDERARLHVDDGNGRFRVRMELPR